MNINAELIEKWVVLKQAEKAAQEQRRQLEDEIAENFDVTEGSFKYGNLKFTIPKKYEIDADILNKLGDLDEDEVARLVEWTPKLNTKEWRAKPYAPLNDVMKVKLGRPTVTWEV